MATITTQVSSDLAAALAPLDGLLTLDSFAVETMVKDALEEIGSRLVRLSEGWDEDGDLSAGSLRDAARQLSSLADAVDVLRRPDPFVDGLIEAIRRDQEANATPIHPEDSR